LAKKQVGADMPLSDLTPEQQQAFKDRLKELRIDPSKVVPKIAPSTHPGPVTLSANPARSTIAPHMVTVTSLDEVKRLAGNPDADFESGLMAEHHDVQPPWPAELNGKASSELTAEQNRQITAAEIAYIYGNSKHHASYKAIIEQHKYPADFAVFAAEDVCIDASNSPFIIGSDSAHNYGTMTICEGGTLKFEANAVLTIQKLIRSTETKCP
jgi:hypothetical protein